MRNDGPKLPARPTALGTVLFRTKVSSTAFGKQKSDATTKQLTQLPGVIDVRVNARRNVVAADAATSDALEALLTTTNICGMEVSPREPASRSTGVIVVDDETITTEDIVACLETPVAVQSAVRRGTAVYLRFAAPIPPAEVALYKRRRPVRPCKPRPLQCGKCGRLDHATASCNRERRCWRCGGPHMRAACRAEKPSCSNCGGPHPVLDHSCPLWREERRVCAALARAQAPASRVAVRAALRAAAHPGLAPATAVTTQQHPDSSDGNSRRGVVAQQQNKVQAAPGSIQAASARPKRGRWSRRQQQEGLTLVLRTLGELLPADSHLRPLCAQAAQGHQHPEHRHG